MQAALVSPPSVSLVELRNELRARVKAGALELPILPGVAAEVGAMSARADVDPKKLADALRRDPAMAAHLLRLANSALYRPRTAIISLQQALSRLGMDLVRRLALAIACESRVFVARGYEKDAREAFAHALRTALFAQEIARMRRANVEDAFLGALLHDVGTVVLLQAVADFSATHGSVRREDALAAVHELHAQVGASLVRAWGLPSLLSEAVLHHHAPESAKLAQDGAATIAIADALADLDEPSDAQLRAMRSHPLAESLDLYPADMSAILDKRAAVVMAAELR